jgi:hypothetical protein
MTFQTRNRSAPNPSAPNPFAAEVEQIAGAMPSALHAARLRSVAITVRDETGLRLALRGLGAETVERAVRRARAHDEGTLSEREQLVLGLLRRGHVSTTNEILAACPEDVRADGAWSLTAVLCGLALRGLIGGMPPAAEEG